MDDALKSFQVIGKVTPQPFGNYNLLAGGVLIPKDKKQEAEIMKDPLFLGGRIVILSDPDKTTDTSDRYHGETQVHVKEEKFELFSNAEMILISRLSDTGKKQLRSNAYALIYNELDIDVTGEVKDYVVKETKTTATVDELTAGSGKPGSLSLLASDKSDKVEEVYALEDLTPAGIMKKLDAKGITYNPKAKKQELYDLLYPKAVPPAIPEKKEEEPVKEKEPALNTAGAGNEVKKEVLPSASWSSQKHIPTTTELMNSSEPFLRKMCDLEGLDDEGLDGKDDLVEALSVHYTNKSQEKIDKIG